MKPLPAIAWLTAMAALLLPAPAGAQNRAAYEKMVADHARTNHVPETLVHRVIVRESKYHPDLVGRGGTIGLMQIKLPTARGLGYQGDAEGLRDPDTNLTYGVKYLAGAWRAAEGDHDRAVHLYASGYYEVAKRQRLERARHPEPVLASAPPQEPVQAKEAAVEPKQTASESKEAAADTAAPAEAEPEQAEKSKEAIKPSVVPGVVAANPMASHAAKPKPPAGPLVLTPILAKLKAALTPTPPKAASKHSQKKLAEARERVPRPQASVSSSANAAKPR
jgi:hypothetical protein